MILFIIMILTIAAIISTLFFHPVPEADAPEESQEQVIIIEDALDQDRTITMVAMGDMVPHDTIIANAKTSDGYDFSKYFQYIRNKYEDADLVFCNQEGLSSGDKYIISGYPAFNAPIEFAKGLSSGAGCNLISLANNHIGDKSISAMGATIDVWNELKPLAQAGANKTEADQQQISVFTVNDTKVAFLAFTDFNNNKTTPSYAINVYHDTELMNSLVKKARGIADLVIVSMHWGDDGSNKINQEQIDIAKDLNEMGVDVIVGTGPHVLQAESVLTNSDGHKTLVWYSLGNMLSSQLNINQLISGIAKFKITIDKEGQVSFSDIAFQPTYMHYEWTVSEAAASNLLARKNAMIYPFDMADDPLSRSLFHTSISEQKQYIINTLGKGVTVSNF